MRTFLFLSIFATFFVYADDKRSITVNGQCELKIAPDRGAIIFTAEYEDKNVKAVTSKTNEISTKLIKKLKDLKLKQSQVSTESYNVHERHDWENGKRVFRGHKASLAVRIETSEIGKLSKAIDAANELGITNIGQMQVFTSNELKQKLDLDCLKMAADNAKTKASKILDNLDAKLGKVIEVIEGAPARVNFPPIPMLRHAKMAMAESAPAPDIEAKMEYFKKDVTFTFEIK